MTTRRGESGGSSPRASTPGRGAAWTEERGTSDEGRRRLKASRLAGGSGGSSPRASTPGRGAAWTEERGTSDEGRRRLKASRQPGGSGGSSPRASTGTDRLAVGESVVYRTVLPGGLRIITESLPAVRSASFGIWAGVGS